MTRTIRNRRRESHRPLPHVRRDAERREKRDLAEMIRGVTLRIANQKVGEAVEFRPGEDRITEAIRQTSMVTASDGDQKIKRSETQPTRLDIETISEGVRREIYDVQEDA